MKSNLTTSKNNTLKRNDFGETFLYSVNRDAFTKISAQSVYDKELKPTLLNENTLYILIGTDSGLLAKYLNQQENLPTGTRYLFVEPQDILTQLKENHLIEHDMNDAIVFTSINDWEQKAIDLHLKEYSYLRNVVLKKSICAQQAHIPEYIEINWAVAERLEGLEFQFRVSLGCKTFLVLQLKNIADNIQPARLLSHRYRDKTGIVLAGGPSLADILPWVKQNRDKLIIFAVSRISRILIKHNIEPDIVVSVDPQPDNIDVSKEMFLFKESIFIHSFHVDNHMISQWPGVNLYLDNRFPWQSKLNPKNFHSAGSTVSNCALAIALQSGCRRVLLAGFDLCLSKEGITHSKGTDEAELGPNFNTSLLEVETYGNEKRPSDPDFLIALQNLNLQGENAKKEGKQVFNLAQFAAKANSIPYCSPDSIAFIENDFNHDIPTLKEPSAEELQQYYHEATQELKLARFQIQSIHKLASKALNINSSMYNEQGEIENYKHKQELDKIEQTFKRKYRKFNTLVKNFGIESFVRIITPHDNEIEHWSAEKAKAVAETYYQSYLTGCEQLTHCIDDSLQRIQIRQEELKENPDFAQVLGQWEKDESYHRAAIWQQQHPTASLDAEIKNQLDALNKQFQRYLTSTETGFKKRMQANSDLSLIKPKALLLFNHHKKNKLRDLLSGLEQHPAPIEEKAPFKALLSAYIDDLDNNIPAALENYDSVINHDKQDLWELALIRITSLSIDSENQENALLALRCLSDISPLYLPFYAEASKLSGNTLDAIDSLNHFIALFPDDIPSKIQLCNLYMDLEVYDAVEMMLDVILSQDENSHTALQLKKKVEALKERS